MFPNRRFSVGGKALVRTTKSVVHGNLLMKSSYIDETWFGVQTVRPKVKRALSFFYDFGLKFSVTE